jgi:hypothetical protein
MRHAYALPDLDHRIIPVDVDAVPLRTLVVRYGLDSIDLMLTDAEGFDDEIVRQIDLKASWAPRFLIFEVKHSTIEGFRKTRGRLEEAGYTVVTLFPDALAYREAPERLSRHVGAAGTGS